MFLLLFSAMQAFPQKGYIITKNGDTTKCIVQKELVGNGVKYRLTKNSALQKIDPDSIREYQLTSNGAIYLLQYLHDKNTYVKWIEKGKINLFEEHYTITSIPTRHGNEPVNTTCWYVCKNDMVLQPLPADDVECRTLIMNLFSDNFNLTVAFRATNDVSIENIQDYIKQYNKAALTAGK
jgi:hypothetical protein